MSKGKTGREITEQTEKDESFPFVPLLLWKLSFLLFVALIFRLSRRKDLSPGWSAQRRTRG
jgi:hypothetical protein